MHWKHRIINTGLGKKLQAAETVDTIREKLIVLYAFYYHVGKCIKNYSLRVSFFDRIYHFMRHPALRLFDTVSVVLYSFFPLANMTCSGLDCLGSLLPSLSLRRWQVSWVVFSNIETIFLSWKFKWIHHLTIWIFIIWFAVLIYCYV